MAKAAIIDDIHDNVAARLDEVQMSLANHRKNCVALYKLHAQASKMKQGDKLTGEGAFEEEILQMIAQVLVVKKEPTAERVVRFIGAYVKHINVKAAEEQEKKGGNVTETVASRFTTRLMNWLLEGFSAKNKIVRGRVVQIVSEMMAGIGEMDEDTYNLLRYSLIQRTTDKEATIRVYAIVGLSKLVGTEDSTDLEPGEKTSMQMLLEAVTYDPAPEVRRAALANLPVTPEVLPVILQRTRDTDTATRKLIYGSVLQAKLGHPRRLTIAQREDVVKTGLGDREPVVRIAVSKMLASWFDIASADPDMQELDEWAGDDGGVMKGFIQFLCLFDVVGPGVKIAVDAVLAIFTARPALVEVFQFPEQYWTSLTPESAVLARVFVEHCQTANKQGLLEQASLPVLSSFAFNIQEQYNLLLSNLAKLEFARDSEADNEEIEQLDEEIDKCESILKEILHITLCLDFADELGRRKIFAVVRSILGHTGLRESVIEPALDILRQITPSEQELIRIVVELVSDLRDAGEDIDDNDASRSDAGSVITMNRKETASIRRARDLDAMSPEERREADEKDLRSLALCIGMLERVNGTFEDNVTLEGMLADLIIPAVKRKDLAMREKGLVALGLCCLIAKNMALNSFQLFLGQLQNAPEELRIKVLQIVFDILIMYEYDFLARSEETAQQIITFLLQLLEAEEVPEVQAILCIGICKLLLAGLIRDTKVLLLLVITYISPSTADNLQLRQCLTYFFPVYCYSSLQNQSRMQSIFVQAYDHASELRDDLDDEQEMISLQQMSVLMTDWTDQEKSVAVLPEQATKRNIHAALAIDLLKELYDSDRRDDDRKIFLQTLNQLHIDKELDARSILKLSILVEHLEAQCPLNNSTMERSMTKFRLTLAKLFGEQLENMDTEALIDEDVRTLYEFIAVDVPTDAFKPQFERSSIIRQGKLDTSMVTDDESSAPAAAAAPPRASRNRNKSKLESDDEEFTTSPHNISPMKPATKRRGREASLQPRGVSPLRKKRPGTRLKKGEVPETPAPQRRSHRKTKTPMVQTYAEPDDVIEEEDEQPEVDKEVTSNKPASKRADSEEVNDSAEEVEEELLPSDED